jgi:hypothetical protein
MTSNQYLPRQDVPHGISFEPFSTIFQPWSNVGYVFTKLYPFLVRRSYSDTVKAMFARPLTVRKHPNSHPEANG